MKFNVSKMKYVILLSLIFLWSCSGNKQPAKDINETANHTLYSIKYAKGFSVNISDEYKEITVRNPWDTTKILKKYILVDKNKELPDNLPEGTVIRTPLSKVATFSTIHTSTLNEINVLNSIIGVCEPRFINIPYIKDGVNKGTITDLGEASKPDIEKIIEISPEAMFISPLQGMGFGGAEKTGVPIIETPDYMEHTALGRAEWIRFYSLFYDNESYVDSLFSITVENYNRIKEKSNSATNRPTVFLDLMYNGTWYISGGNSFISKMLQDAGAKYIWHDDGRDQSTPLPFEQVLDKAGEADFWLVKYFNDAPFTYTSLAKEYKPYTYFKAYKERNIYECNTQQRDYFGILPIHPDYILQDFASIFHPELFPDYRPQFYFRMKE